MYNLILTNHIRHTSAHHVPCNRVTSGAAMIPCNQYKQQCRPRGRRRRTPPKYTDSFISTYQFSATSPRRIRAPPTWSAPLSGNPRSATAYDDLLYFNIFLDLWQILWYSKKQKSKAVSGTLWKWCTARSGENLNAEMEVKFLQIEFEMDHDNGYLES